MCIAEGIPELRRAAPSGMQWKFSVSALVTTVILLILCIAMPLGIGHSVSKFCTVLKVSKCSLSVCWMNEEWYKERMACLIMGTKRDLMLIAQWEAIVPQQLHRRIHVCTDVALRNQSYYIYLKFAL